MKSAIEFASPAEMEAARILFPVSKPATKPAFEDMVLRPEYQSRKFTFHSGQTCVRILPQLSGAEGWMHRIHVLAHPHGQHLHSKCLTPKGKSVFDVAYGWLRSNRPETLQNKANRDGFRLLPAPMAICWILAEIGGKMQAKLFMGSAYNGGPVGGNCGIAHQLLQAASQLREPGGYDAAHPDHGSQIIVEKTTPTGAKYPTYKMTRASVEAPIHRYLERMDESEIAAIRPLSEVLRRVEPETEWELLGKVLGEELRDEIRNSTAKPKPSSSTKPAESASPSSNESFADGPPVSDESPIADGTGLDAADAWQ
jgi:hypothetical protein